MINQLYVVTLIIVIGLTASAQVQTFTTLYNFTGGSDGGEPYAALIQDPAGNLYGTTSIGGGSSNSGTIFKVGSSRNFTLLHSFAGPNGAYPVTPVARDKAGNLYGTTFSGGKSSIYCGIGGCGTVFKIDTAGHEKVLHRFSGGSDGCNPGQGLVRDTAGDLYGTTTNCGSSAAGTIFKVDRAGNFTLLHSFAGGSSDGAYPQFGSLVMDQSGNLYGLASAGGGSTACYVGCGVLYRMSTKGTFRVLYSFAGGTSDGCQPFGSVARDKYGNLYGTTSICGAHNYGTVWKVSQRGKETILHNFAGGPSDGCGPGAGVTRDSNGNSYGVAGCGAYTYYGALYKLSSKGRLTLLHSFDDLDGANPSGEVIRTTKGTLFGTTSAGGTHSYYGTVWSYCPKGLCAQ